MTAFQEHVLNAPDVCNNCFQTIRRERSRTTSSTLRSDVTAEKSAYTRVRQTTEIDHVPGGLPSQSITVWCECGTQSAFDRWWDDGDDRCLRMSVFKALLKQSIYALERKSVTLNRRTVIETAIHQYRRNHDVNEALAEGVKSGITTAVASESPRATPPTAD